MKKLLIIIITCVLGLSVSAQTGLNQIQRALTDNQFPLATKMVVLNGDTTYMQEYVSLHSRNDSICILNGPCLFDLNDIDEGVLSVNYIDDETFTGFEILSSDDQANPTTTRIPFEVRQPILTQSSTGFTLSIDQAAPYDPHNPLMHIVRVNNELTSVSLNDSITRVYIGRYDAFGFQITDHDSIDIIHPLPEPNTDDQALTLVGNTLTLEDGGTVDLSAYLDDTDTDDQALTLVGNTLTLEDGGTVDLSAYLDNTDTDDQALTLVGNILTLEDGGTVDLSAYLDDTDTDDQALTLVGNILTLEDGGTVDLSAYLDNTDTDDQALTLVGNILTLEDGGTVDLSAYLDNTDTDDQALTLVGNILTLEDGGTVDLSQYLDNTDTDDQALTLVGNTLTLEDGGAVDLSAYLDNTDTDDQALTLVGNILTLEDGGTVDLSAYLDDTDTDDQALTLVGNILTLEDGGTVDLSAYLDDTDTDDQALTLVGNILTLEDGGTVDLTQYLDDLGNHEATQNIHLNGRYLSGDGGNEGLLVDNIGNVGIGSPATSGYALSVYGKIDVDNVDDNIIIGEFAGDNYNGDFSTIVGRRAGRSGNANADYNVAIGFSALENAINGNRSIAIGLNAGKFNEGGQNVLIGYQAGLNNNGDGNTFIGERSGEQNTTGYDNIAIGTESLRYNTIGYGNLAYGKNALRTNSGNGNIAIGPSSGAGNSGSNNIFIGSSTANNNVFDQKMYIGNGSLPLIEGNMIDNTLKINGSIGYTAQGGTATSVLGRDANGNLTTNVPSSLLGSSPWTVSGANIYRAGGNVGIGTTSPFFRLHVDGSVYINNGKIIDGFNNGGSNGQVLGVSGSENQYQNLQLSGSISSTGEIQITPFTSTASTQTLVMQIPESEPDFAHTLLNTVSNITATQSTAGLDSGYDSGDIILDTSLEEIRLTDPGYYMITVQGTVSATTTPTTDPQLTVMVEIDNGSSVLLGRVDMSVIHYDKVHFHVSKPMSISPTSADLQLEFIETSAASAPLSVTNASWTIEKMK